ncbi:hypothetical protein PTSG_12795 [Salpingoeca rosetta]|uniref:Amino acid transporter transmembrane domain-containing protein n=1 Tax=Salpingoeca rosetta (strain ATCC 50818 / BSB-021) TaxID=946362 RepID=F2UKP2_SALR5|nr:uncharacterized protein PTSG_12795 [Salpingoeca rosetta]EGD77691.1 hypothetical protein PTSG_12795 [Salpingoeca rosetta]|eukprot:XP_004990167.1 hypothetical protein PTSG_12795 [Salpingoeca rosetta]
MMMVTVVGKVVAEGRVDQRCEKEERNPNTNNRNVTQTKNNFFYFGSGFEGILLEGLACAFYPVVTSPLRQNSTTTLLLAMSYQVVERAGDEAFQLVPTEPKTYGSVVGESSTDDDDQLEFPLISRDTNTTSIPSAIFNLTNTIIGAGVLSLPFAFKNTGVIIGPVLLVSVYFLVVYSCVLLVSASKACGGRSFSEIASCALGRPGIIATQISLVIATFGAATSYLVIVGDMMSPLIGQWMGGTNEDFCSIYADRRFSISLSLLVVCPLCMFKHIDSLRYVSYLAIAMVSYLLVIVVVRSGESLNKGSGQDVNFINVTETIFRAMPIITLAYTCQMNLFALLSTLESPTRRNVRRVIYGALSVCMVMYILIGLFGYLTFFQEIKGNVLLNYEVDDTAVMVGRVGVALIVLCSFPLMMNPCLVTLEEMLFHAGDATPPEQRPFRIGRRAVIMTATVGLAYTIAMLVADVSVVLGISGAIGSIAISFILPPLFVLKLKPNMPTRQKILPATLAVVGVAVLVVSLVVTILDAIDAGDDLNLAHACNRSALHHHNATNATTTLLLE